MQSREIIPEYGTFSGKTRIILSFGAIYGGFEYALQLRRDLYQRFDVDLNDEPTFCYLDAESLRMDPGTKYTWTETLGIFKMSNDKWKEFYLSAMEEANWMVFFITEPWLHSKWCWDELGWCSEIIDRNVLNVLFVIFHDARELLQRGGEIEDKDGGLHELSALTEIMDRGHVINLESGPEQAPGRVKVKKATYKYIYLYATTAKETEEIMDTIQYKAKL